MVFKRTYILLFLGLALSLSALGQVKIGDDVSTIHPSSLLELESTTKALVMSRLSNTQMLAMTPLEGALVFNTDTKCLHLYNGSNWTNLCNNTPGSFSILDNEDGSFTINAPDGSTFTSPNLKGPQGEKGDTGETGPQGPAGEDGANTIEQQQIIIIASDGQTKFPTPAPIIDMGKINVYRNGIRIDFTTVDANTIQLESEATCYNNDRIRIVQIL